jgi:tryptophan synthase alpha chain
MSRLQGVFQQARQSGRKLLIPYLTAGDPSLEATVSLMHAVVAAGADVVEVGVPFSDPMADGPVIQAACERALANGTSLRKILETVSTFRRRDTTTPVVLMGYLNPVEAMGYEKFAASAKTAGVDAVLLVDLMPEESDIMLPLLKQQGLDCVYLVAPTTTPARMDLIARQASGYLYYVSLKGVTGANRLDVDGVAGKVSELRQHTQLPIAVGFGISDARTAAAVAAVADAVVVGSRLVSLIGELGQDEAEMLKQVSGVVADMREAMDAAPNPTPK